VRARFEARFSASRMAREYERAYRDIVADPGVKGFGDVASKG
jgi:hypothetical protein